jgi:hypothetical protein
MWQMEYMIHTVEIDDQIQVHVYNQVTNQICDTVNHAVYNWVQLHVFCRVWTPVRDNVIFVQGEVYDGN